MTACRNRQSLPRRAALLWRFGQVCSDLSRPLGGFGSSCVPTVGYASSRIARPFANRGHKLVAGYGRKDTAFHDDQRRARVNGWRSRCAEETRQRTQADHIDLGN